MKELLKIKEGHFKQIEILPFAIDAGSMYFMTCSEFGIHDFIYSSATAKERIGFLNAPSGTVRDLKVGQLYNGGQPNLKRYNELLENYGLDGKRSVNPLMIAFEMALMISFKEFDVVLMTTAGLNKESIMHLVSFAEHIITYDQLKSLVIIQNNFLGVQLPYTVRKIDVNDLARFRAFLDQLEIDYRIRSGT